MSNRIGKSLAALAATSMLALVALLAVAGLRTQDNTGVIYDITSGQYQYNAGIAGIGAVPIPTTDTIVLTAQTPASFNSKVTIAANSLRRGRIIKVEASGTLHTLGTPGTVTLRVRSFPTGTAVTLAAFPAVAVAAHATGTVIPWVVNSSSIVQVPGGVATAQADRSGLFSLHNIAAATPLPALLFHEIPNILTAGVSTTLANPIGIEVESGSGTTAVRFVLRQLIVRFEN